MPEFKITWTERQYTAYKALVEADSPQEAMRIALEEGLRTLNAEDDGFADGPRDDQGPLIDTLQVEGRYVPHGADGETFDQFDPPVKRGSCSPFTIADHLCPACDGWGRTGPDKRTLCERCKGRGVLRYLPDPKDTGDPKEDPV
jgi:hypothetical protein